MIGSKIVNSRVLLIDSLVGSDAEHIPADKCPVKQDRQLKVTFVFTQVLQPTILEAT